jgi:hypothetical protein
VLLVRSQRSTHRQEDVVPYSTGIAGYNQGFAYTERVGPGAIGCSVLDHLAGRYRHSTTDEWARRLEAGEVRLDGVAAAPSERLRAGQHLVWHRPPWREPPAPCRPPVASRSTRKRR